MTSSHLNLRVYYEDTDAGGIVYHARYLAFAERARTEMLRELGLNHIELMDRHGLFFVVRHAELDYQRPARLDDWLTVTTTVERTGGASCVLRQDVSGERGLLVVVRVRLACVRAADGRPARWPGAWAQVLGQGRTAGPAMDGFGLTA